MILHFVILQIYSFHDNDCNEHRLKRGSYKYRLQFQFLLYHILHFLIYRAHPDNKFPHSLLFAGCAFNSSSIVEICCLKAVKSVKYAGLITI